jgi:hypothetical protein
MIGSLTLINGVAEIGAVAGDDDGVSFRWWKTGVML